jgi:hypothetical protein
MAKTFDEIAVFTGSTTLARSLRAVSTLRLVLGLTALLGAIIFLEGTSWDIQWHSYIGRDRTLIPPHIMMLSGVALSGISGLLTVLIESWWARRNTIIAQYSVGLPTAAILVEVLAVYGKKFVSSIGMYFAMVNDPDGNTILLYADNHGSVRTLVISKMISHALLSHGPRQLYLAYQRCTLLN